MLSISAATTCIYTFSTGLPSEPYYYWKENLVIVKIKSRKTWANMRKKEELSSPRIFTQISERRLSYDGVLWLLPLLTCCTGLTVLEALKCLSVLVVNAIRHAKISASRVLSNLNANSA